MADNLSNLIIQRILANIGANNSGKNLGLMDSNFLIKKTLKIKYDTGVIEHSVYAGNLKLDEVGILEGLLVNLTVDDIPEYLFVFRINDMPMHAAKTVFIDNEIGETYLKIRKGDSWKDASMYFKARLLADFERITSFGLLWQESDNSDELFDAAVELMS